MEFGNFQKILICDLIYLAEAFVLDVLCYDFQQLGQSSDVNEMNVEMAERNFLFFPSNKKTVIKNLNCIKCRRI